MNYEDEIELKILNELKYKYNFKSEDILYRYLILKHRLLTINNKEENLIKNDMEFMNFIFSELTIKRVIYKDSPITSYGFENNFMNIIDNWRFRYEWKDIIDEKEVKYSFNDYTNKILKDISTYARKQSKFAKNNPYYNEIYSYFKLKKLNELFNIVEINKPRKIGGFIYDESYEFEITVEEKLYRYYHSVNFITTSLRTITEEDFEDYVYKHLNSVEEGLKPIERQYQIDNGRIDILAKDKDNNTVIIELKIANDKHLIWQVLYYPIALKKKIGEKNIRIITICPEYPDYIQIPLKQISGVEMIKYNASISNKKIRNVEFQKLQ